MVSIIVRSRRLFHIAYSRLAVRHLSVVRSLEVVRLSEVENVLVQWQNLWAVHKITADQQSIYYIIIILLPK